jgi:hypothetical protein
VWRSENGGESSSRLARGLPKKQSYFTVLRDAMDIDRLKTTALYFGTTTGQLWIGREGGEQWDCLFRFDATDSERQDRGRVIAQAGADHSAAGRARRSPKTRRKLREGE